MEKPFSLRTNSGAPKILVALDGSELGEQILLHLLALVNQETKVHLLCVVTTHLLHPKNEESVKKVPHS